MLNLKKLKQARLDMGLTQGDVAKHLGYKSPNTIGNYESGERDISANDLANMVGLYEISFEWLYDKSEEKELIKISVTQRELHLIKLFRAAPERDKSIIENILSTSE